MDTIAEADREDVDVAVQAARRAFDDGPWAKAKPNEHSCLLWRLAALNEAHLEGFAEIESWASSPAFRQRGRAELDAQHRSYRAMTMSIHPSGKPVGCTVAQAGKPLVGQ